MKPLLPAAAVAFCMVAAPAFAGPYDDLFFARPSAKAAAMLTDREECSGVAQTLPLNASSFGNPDYGVLAAMGARLDDGEDAAKARKAVRRAIVVKCMEKKGWTETAALQEDVKKLKKASLAHPEALDAWLAAQPAPAPPTLAPPGTKASN